MAIILGIDSTGDELTLGLLKEKMTRISHGKSKPHSRQLLPLIRKLLQSNRPEAIVVVTGPGSYTGTRIGVTVANTLGWAWAIPVLGMKKDGLSMPSLLKRGEQRLAKGVYSTTAWPYYPSVVR